MFFYVFRNLSGKLPDLGAGELTQLPPSLPCDGMGEAKMPFCPLPIAAVAGERAGPGVTRVGELAQTLTSCST